MNEELDYAQMLEIPVETVTVKHRAPKRFRRQSAESSDLSEQLVEEVNDRMQQTQEGQEESDPNFVESKLIEREAKPTKKRRVTARRVLITEVVAVCVLCATIFFTNIFMTNSAINTFVRNLFQGNAQTVDKRTYQDFKLSPVVSADANAELQVSETGVLSFTARCSVYAPADGTVQKVNGSKEEGYTVQVKHSENFSTVLSGLDAVYLAEGESVKSNIPVGYTDGDGAVNVMMYDGEKLLNCYNVDENKLAWI